MNVNTRVAGLGVALMTMLASANVVGAQQPAPARPTPPTTQAPRRQETIEIRGQVPTPQVVTVRPREAPAYTRRVLVPTFLDHDFWPSILPPLELVSPPGAVRADSSARAPSDSTARARMTTPRPSSGTPPAPLRR